MSDEQWSRVHDRYRAAARRVAAGEGTGLLTDATEAAELGPALYNDVDGVPMRAIEASLGCGNPLAVVDIQPGDVVLDLGSGGGLDVLLSAKRAGPAGRAIGIDMTDEMLQLAREHAEKAGVSNVEFLKGRIEDVPLPDGAVDVVISNCVIALSPDKAAVFAEIARVLRSGGRVGIADVIVEEGAAAFAMRRRLPCQGGHGGAVRGAARARRAQRGQRDAVVGDGKRAPVGDRAGAKARAG